MKYSSATLAFVVLFGPQTLEGATKDLGAGFRDHGVATPISNHRGTVVTVDGRGTNLVLSWLNDYRGGYELLLIDAETGKHEEHPMPFPPGDHPFASILSSQNRFYTHFNSHFVEFDPAKRAFTFCATTKPRVAMSMTEDDEGIIWSATYPAAGLASFNPKTLELRDYGSISKENWAQYPRSVAADDEGWVYVGIGSTRHQIMAFNRESGVARALVPDDQRIHGYGMVERDQDGKVYAAPVGENGHWLRMHKGTATVLTERGKRNPKSYVSGSQGLFHDLFPGGKRLSAYSLSDRRIAVSDPKSGEVKTYSFDYNSEGAHIMGVAVAPNGTICGGTAFPMWFFSYDPHNDSFDRREAYGQWNTLARQGDRLFVGGYTHGFLLEWDPAKPWIPTENAQKGRNPEWLTSCAPAINRPHDLLACPDGKTLVLSGTPGYGLTGGGLMFWDRESRASKLLKHTEVLPQQSTMSLAALPSRKFLGGTTTSAGTGGEKKAMEAELYIMDMDKRNVEWHAPLLPKAQNYTDLCTGLNDLVFGFADQKRFFVFDPAKRRIIHEQETGAQFGPCVSPDGPRAFVTDSKGNFYIIFVKGIARLNPRTFKITLLARSPVSIHAGGDYFDGRIYFCHGSHLYSYSLEQDRERHDPKPHFD